MPYRLICLLVCVAGWGCASPWRELRTEHFVMYTDAEPSVTIDALDGLEQTRAAFLRVMPPQAATASGSLTVVLLHGRKELHTFARGPVSGFVSRSEFASTAVVTPGRGSTTDPTLAHELAHSLSAFYLARQPRWYAEGLAQYLETVAISDDGREATIGQATLEQMRMLTYFGRVPVSRLWDWDAVPFARDVDELGALYSTSWLLVHFLRNHEQAGLALFEKGLSEGTEPKLAWRSAFGDRSDDAWESALKAYLDQRQYSAVRFQLPGSGFSTRERFLSPSEVHALRARLFLIAIGLTPAARKEKIAAELEEADALHSADPEVIALRELVEPAASLVPDARRALAERPDSGRARLVLARVLRDGDPGATNHDEEYRLLEEARERMPDDVEVLTRLALVRVEQGRGDEGLSLAERASTLAPWSTVALIAKTSCLLALKRCSEAVPAARRACEVAGEGTARAVAARCQEMRRKAEQLCPQSQP